jgi:hypothetical protein
MKRLLLLCVAFIAAGSTAAFATGVNLGWDDCAGVGGAPGDKFGTAAFSCNTNASGAGSSSSIVASFVLATSIPNFVTIEAVLDMRTITADHGLAPWWDFGNFPSVATPGCRVGEMLYSFRNAGTSCMDWPGPAPVTGNMTFERGIASPNAARIRLIAAYTSGTPQPIVAGDEMVAFTFVINNAKTVGTGSCAGCATPVCMAFDQLVVGQSPAVTPQLTLQDADVRHFITWNDAAGTTGCPGIVPTHTSTWGQVKSLYRE